MYGVDVREGSAGPFQGLQHLQHLPSYLRGARSLFIVRVVFVLKNKNYAHAGYASCIAISLFLLTGMIGQCDAHNHFPVKFFKFSDVKLDLV